MKYYYVDSQNNTAGPVTLEELQGMIQTSILKNNPMVIPEGGTEWKPLSAFVSPGQPTEPPAAAQSPIQGGITIPFSRTFLGDLVAAPLNRIKRWLNEDFTNRTLEFCRNTGHYVILVGGALGLISCIVSAIRGNQLIPAVIGVGFVIALAIAQFIAMQFLSAGDALITNTPHRISSKAFLECCGLFGLLGALGLFAAGFFAGVSVGKNNGWVAIVIFTYCATIAFQLVYLTAIAFNPRTVNISAGSGSAGEEAVGILGFFLKALLKLLPIQFLFSGIFAVLMILEGFSSRSQQMNAFSGDLLGERSPLGSLLSGNSVLGEYSGIALLLFACLLPFIGYFLFVLFNLGLEVIRAILSLTEKQPPLAK